MVSSIVEAQPDDELAADFDAAIGPCDDLAQASTTRGGRTPCAKRGLKKKKKKNRPRASRASMAACSAGGGVVAIRAIEGRSHPRDLAGPGSPDEGPAGRGDRHHTPPAVALGR